MTDSLDATALAEYLGSDDTDRPLHEAAAAAAGIELDHLVWSDPEAAWDRYDLVVVRSTWDYLGQLGTYLSWLAAMDGLGTLHNPGRVIAWNLDKRYLLELATSGVPVIPTRVCSDPDDVADVLAGVTEEVVVKPVVSAGSKRTGRFTPDDPAARALAGQILATIPSGARHGNAASLPTQLLALVHRDGEAAQRKFVRGCQPGHTSPKNSDSRFWLSRTCVLGVHPQYPNCTCTYRGCSAQERPTGKTRIGRHMNTPVLTTTLSLPTVASQASAYTPTLGIGASAIPEVGERAAYEAARRRGHR